MGRKAVDGRRLRDDEMPDFDMVVERDEWALLALDLLAMGQRQFRPSSWRVVA